MTRLVIGLLGFGILRRPTAYIHVGIRYAEPATRAQRVRNDNGCDPVFWQEPQAVLSIRVEDGCW